LRLSYHKEMKDIVKLLRPHQYVKNIFIFAPILFAFEFSLDKFESSFVAFVLFCMISSSIYILNDIFDIKEDQKHPKKRYRPIASGAISKKSATTLFMIFSFLSLLSAYLYNINLFYIFVIYFVLNVAYSLGLKHISLVDIFIISTGFVLRLFAGSVVTDVKLSSWIILITFLLAVFLALAKRRDDVLLFLKGERTRKNIDGYNLEFINASMVLMAAVVVVSYILYTVSDSVTQKFNTEYLFVTSFFVILGILRYMQITFVEQESGSPTKIVLRDRFLQFCLLFWIASFIGIIKYL